MSKQTEKKPVAKVIGHDGNVFVTLGICTKSLKKEKQAEKAKELTERVFKSGSYEEAIQIMSEYCDLR